MTKEIYQNKELQDEYRGHFGARCEVWQHLPAEAKAKCKRLGHAAYGKKDIHHIFHNNGRIDEWSNLISVNFVVHINWGHSFHNREFTIVCLYAKWWKSKQPKNLLHPYPEDEFNLEELRYCLGRDVLHWLGSAMQNYSECSDYYRMCLEIRESY